MQRLARLIAPRFHYGWIALAVVFLILLCAAGTRATPSVMMLPLEHEFGWNAARSRWRSRSASPCTG